MTEHIILVLLLIAVANGTPVVMHKLFGQRWSAALDGGRPWRDSRPLFGPSKTLRGLLSALLACARFLVC